MLQSTTGINGTVTLDHNTFNGYTRGVNLQRPGTDFIFTNNTITSTVSEPDRAAIQLTDGKSFVVNGNTVRVNAGNAFWFHNAATNNNVTYTISNNDIEAAYFVKCVGFEKDEDGNVTTVHCTYDPETRSGSGFEGRKVKGTIHWVSAESAIDAEVRLYENIIDEEKGKLNDDGTLNLNPNSLVIKQGCKLEKAFEEAQPGEAFQFLRNGFFCVDSKDSTAEHPVYNRIVSLKSSYKPGK